MNSRYRLFLLTLIVAVLVIFGGLLIDKNQVTIASDGPSTEVSLGVERSDLIVVKIYYESQEQLNEVAGQLDIWEDHRLPGIGPDAGYALAAVYPAQKDWLEQLGYRVEIDQAHTAMVQAPAAPLDPRYYYFDNYYTNPNGLYIVDFLQQTEAAYPDLIELTDIGDAWQASHGGHVRDMWVLRITNEDPAYGDIANKPPFFMFANIHAREVTTPEMAIRYIKYFTQGYQGIGGYGVDPDVTWLVDHHVVYLLVSQNPDGRVVNEMNWNEYRRKNMDTDDGCSYTSELGVDLNRNHTFMWGCCGGSSGEPCSETYRGPTAGSEPETAAFEAFAQTIAFTDQNGANDNNTIVPAPDNTKGLFISLHSYADEILWPFSHHTAPNNAQLRAIARKLADITNNVMYPSGTIGYTVDGASDDWVYGHLGVAAFTYEIGDYSWDCGDFFPDYDCQDGINGASRNFWAELRDSFIYANKISETPYITVFGPDATGLSVTPTTVPAGEPVTLTATIADNRYTGDPLKNIAEAEFFVDAPGVDGSGFAMDPSDGAWGETSEGVTASVDTTGLTEGKHYILVHGKNVDGVWGPFTAIFLDVTEPTVPFAGFSTNSPVELGQPMLFTNETIGSEPITYLWNFGDGTGTSTDLNPTYTYLNVGSYTVTLTATNELGSDSIANLVTVIPLSIDSVSLTKLTPDPVYPGDEVTFNADIFPDEAGKPYTYTITFGDGLEETGTSSADPLSITHVYASVGTYTVEVQVQNESMVAPVISTTEVNVVSYIYRTYLAITIK